MKLMPCIRCHMVRSARMKEGPGGFYVACGYCGFKTTVFPDADAAVKRWKDIHDNYWARKKERSGESARWVDRKSVV